MPTFRSFLSLISLLFYSLFIFNIFGIQISFFTFTTFTPFTSNAFLYFPLIKTKIFFFISLFWFSQGNPQLLLDFFQFLFILWRFFFLIRWTFILALSLIDRFIYLVVLLHLRFIGLFFAFLFNFGIVISLL